MYAAVQKTIQPHIDVPSEWTRENALEFIQRIVWEVLKHTCRLIDFALSSPQSPPPRFVFISSVTPSAPSIVIFPSPIISDRGPWPYNTRHNSDHPGNEPVKEGLADARCAVGMGYPESKWVCGNMLSAASSANPGLKTTVVRVAQLCGTSGIIGASASGCWNTKEWVHDSMRSSKPASSSSAFLSLASIMCVRLYFFSSSHDPR